ncbi:MAG: hypothetical protein Q8L48_41940 [Archangium sp.]|nr:hypothetical protein [Archangium sp.]
MRLVGGVVLCFLSSCKLTDAKPQHRQALEGESEWQTSPYLSPLQKELLTNLFDQTNEFEGNFGVTVWDRGEAPLQILMRVELEGDDPVQKVESFITKYGALWHIDPNDFGTRIKLSSPMPSPCATVIVGLEEADQQVYNAQLKIDLVDGKVVSALGYLDGRPLESEPESLEISSEDARDSLMVKMGWPETAKDVLQDRVVVFDPYFLGSEKRAPAHAFLFTTGDGPETLYSGGFVVLGDGTTPIQGASLPDSAVGIAGSECDSNQSTAWMPEVVADPLLRTPAWISLRGMGGFRFTANSLEGAVHEFMRAASVQRMFGDGAPESHLVKSGRVDPRLADRADLLPAVRRSARGRGLPDC